MNRLCSRPGCADTATATLSYAYPKRAVWIDHLTPERDPANHDLCARHADRLSVPRGWRLEDRRVVRPLRRAERLAG